MENWADCTLSLLDNALVHIKQVGDAGVVSLMRGYVEGYNVSRYLTLTLTLTLTHL